MRMVLAVVSNRQPIVPSYNELTASIHVYTTVNYKDVDPSTARV